ncbi:flagellin [Rhizobium sp. KVB221]|uniref:Flagellin n=1 Tax=Rhizobium setariae TaxID=2801340 RepID=A0A937CJR5_9HYPH|nr:flagellin [Rhizobium setariae]
MTSIVTNLGAMAAVQQLRLIGASRLESQQQVATGYRVESAKDNTAYWSIATTMRSDGKALAAAEDSLGLGAAVVGVAYSSMNFAVGVVDEIKAKLVSARERGVNLAKVNAEIVELRNELYSIADSSSFNGENWLRRSSPADDVDKQMVGSFNRDANSNVAVTSLTYSFANAQGTNHLIDDVDGKGILTSPQYARELGTDTEWVLMKGRQSVGQIEFTLNQSTTTADIDEMISVTDRMLLAMTDVASNLGSMVSRIKLQENFVIDLQDSQARGVGRLVDADLNAASARLRAVETQGKLANQALSIANASPLAMLPLLT